METKENLQSCCSGIRLRHKRVCIISIAIVALVVVFLGLASVGWKLNQYRNGFGMMGAGDYSRCGKMMGYNNRYCPSPVEPNPADQFILPQDAVISGQIAIVVSDLESAKKAVTDASVKNSGNVYSTFISYASKGLRNGSMVVQVPAGNFDNAFADLKKVGTQIIQESTQQIPPNNYYYPVAGAASDVATPASTKENADTPSNETDAKPELISDPAPASKQLVQDKAYIKVIFADYGTSAKKGERDEKRNFAGGFFNEGNSTGQGMKNNLIIVLGVKLIFLIAVLGLMFLVFKRIFQAVKGRKNKITKVHVVRQMTKTQKRVVKIATKKKKI